VHRPNMLEQEPIKSGSSLDDRLEVLLTDLSLSGVFQESLNINKKLTEHYYHSVTVVMLPVPMLQ